MPINNDEKLLQAVEKYSTEQRKAQKNEDRPKNNKTDKFLQALQRYAKEQNNLKKGEVKQIKSERLKEAEKRSQREADRLVKDTLRASRNRQTALLASIIQEGRKALFLERSRMVEDIFKAASDKLTAYTAGDEYKSKLLDSAKRIAELFNGHDCLLYVNERDLDSADSLYKVFNGHAEVRADKSIKIGGIKGYCAELGIIADETLDSKLEAQREWFAEKSSLTVL